MIVLGTPNVSLNLSLKDWAIIVGSVLLIYIARRAYQYWVDRKNIEEEDSDQVAKDDTLSG